MDSARPRHGVDLSVILTAAVIAAGDVTALATAARVDAAVVAGTEAVTPARDASAGERARMVETQIVARGVTDARVLAAMRKVPRHELVPEAWRAQAYEDRPLPIGEGQTISQPYIVALMSELAAVKPGARVLEVGTGSGYQAAVLAELGADVYTIEIVEPLARRARADLERLGYGRVHVRHGDGYQGWPDAAPFAAIVVTAAPPEVPKTLLEQLAPGGRLVVPVGTWDQELQVHERTADGIRVRRIIPVRFVPMVPGASATPGGAPGSSRPTDARGPRPSPSTP